MEARENNLDVTYILPREGTLLRNNASIVNENGFASPNEADYNIHRSGHFEQPGHLPPNEDLLNAELILPLSPVASFSMRFGTVT
jgi:hypothetical protein